MRNGKQRMPARSLIHKSNDGENQSPIYIAWMYVSLPDGLLGMQTVSAERIYTAWRYGRLAL